MQRWLVCAALISGAWLLHTWFCEWMIREPLPEHYLFIGGWYEDKQFRTNSAEAWGIRSEMLVDQTAAFMLGIILPLAMIATTAFLALGARHARRLRLGQCVHCGYNLRHNFAAGCPECGWNRGDKP